jgi:hypothetical protein
MGTYDKNAFGGSATFEARDPSAEAPAVFGERKSTAAGPATFEEKQPSQAGYKGPERRRAHRRDHGDRRVEMRFEMDTPDRRACASRRADDQTANFW